MAVLGVVLLVGAVVALFAFLLFKHLRLRHHFACVPGPRSYPIIGNAAQLKMNPAGTISNRTVFIANHVTPEIIDTVLAKIILYFGFLVITFFKVA